MAQVSPDGRELVATSQARVSSAGDEPLSDAWIDALGEAFSSAYRSQSFHGRDAVFCVPSSDLTLLNIRVPVGDAEQIESSVLEDVKSRLPYDASDAVIRHINAGTINQASSRKCEVVALACQQQIINALLAAAEKAKLNPIAIDVEPGTMQRAYCNQFRRDQERKHTTVIVHIGYDATCIVIHHDSRVHLAKHLAIGGKQLNDAVAAALEIDSAEAARLRNRAAVGGGSDEIRQALQDAIRPLIEQMVREISLCIRYFSVTFRSARADEVLLMGSEAGDSLAQTVQERLGVDCRCSQPFERLGANQYVRQNQWDLPIGLALRGALPA